jgi:Fe-S-cluster containining protein
MPNVLPEGSRQYPTYWLSFHASYACRHSGACCSSGWAIPLEQTRLAGLAAAIADGRIVAPAIWLKGVDGAPDEVAGVLAIGGSGDCVFHGESRACAIHSALGHAAMPAACQHFPRVVLIDTRGVFVTLSHYCPTAAAMLVADDRPVAIVEGPPALPDGASPEGFDARATFPPLRSPRLLMDLDAYSAWERDTVLALAHSDAPDAVVGNLLGGITMNDRELYELARACVPPPYAERIHALALPALSEREYSARVEGRFLAAHAFACWMAYEGNGLLSIAIYLRLVLAVLRTELARQQSVVDAVRQSDLLLRHLIDREALGARIRGLP